MVETVVGVMERDKNVMRTHELESYLSELWSLHNVGNVVPRLEGILNGELGMVRPKFELSFSLLRYGATGVSNRDDVIAIIELPGEILEESEDEVTNTLRVCGSGLTKRSERNLIRIVEVEVNTPFWLKWVWLE